MQTQLDLIAQNLPVNAAVKAISADQGPFVLNPLEMKLVSGGSPKTFWVGTEAVLSPKTYW